MFMVDVRYQAVIDLLYTSATGEGGTNHLPLPTDRGIGQLNAAGNGTVQDVASWGVGFHLSQSAKRLTSGNR